MSAIATEKSVMAVMGMAGDTKTMWDPNNPEEVSLAEETFDKLKKKGYDAFYVEGKNGEKAGRMNRFDKDAKSMILIPRMAGG